MQAGGSVLRLRVVTEGSGVPAGGLGVCTGGCDWV